MQKFVNEVEDLVNESIDGFIKCHNHVIVATSCSRTLKYIGAALENKVGIAIGGGFGHAPAFMGYLGKNAVDTVAIGNIFEPPSVQSFFIAIQEANRGTGVLCVVGNYEGDIANANKAIAQAGDAGIVAKLLVVDDDLGSEEPDNRRGNTGEVLVWKVLGAAASKGYSLENLEQLGLKAVSAIRSIGVGLASCIIPTEGRPNYLIERGTMEIGVSHHGLFSQTTCKLRSANDTAQIMLNLLMDDMHIQSKQEVCVMVSGLGNTMSSELNILYRQIHTLLEDAGVLITDRYVGDFFTSLDMMGATLSIMKLDDELKEMLHVPAYFVSVNHFSCLGE